MTPLHILDPNEEARRRQMHADGRTPGEMAAALGITRQAVHIWHQSRGLSANARPPAGPRVEVRVIGPTSFWQRIECGAPAGRHGPPGDDIAPPGAVEDAGVPELVQRADDLGCGGALGGRHCAPPASDRTYSSARHAAPRAFVSVLMVDSWPQRITRAAGVKGRTRNLARWPGRAILSTHRWVCRVPRGGSPGE